MNAYYGRPIQERSQEGLKVSLLAYPGKQDQPWHYHEDPSLFVLLRGEHIDFWKSGVVGQPSFAALFRPGGEGHRSSTGPGGVIGLNFEFKRDWLLRSGINPAEIGRYEVLQDAWLTWRVVEAVANPVGISSVEASDIAIEFLSQAAGPQAENSAWLTKAVQVIMESAGQDASLTGVADAVGVSPAHLARVFRSVHGCSVTNFIHRVRLTKAIRLMTRPEFSIGDAAIESGFYDQAHLHRYFRKNLALTPLQFCRRLEQIEEVPIFQES